MDPKESFIKFPNPFGLFNKKEKEGATNLANNDPDVSNKPVPGAANKNMSFGGILFGVFSLLAVLLALIYNFNSSMFLIDDMLRAPYYTSDNFWEQFKGQIISGKIAIYIILWMIVFGLNILLFDVMFNNHDSLNIFYITSMFFWTIVGSTFLIIGNIPSLVEVFENTIGYGFMTLPLGMYDVQNTMRCIKNKCYSKSGNVNKGYDISNDFLLTTFDIPSFHEQFDSLAGYSTNGNFDCDFFLDLTCADKSELEKCDDKSTLTPNNPKPDSDISMQKRRELLELVITKNTIGHFTWTFLASCVSMMLTINTIVAT